MIKITINGLEHKKNIVRIVVFKGREREMGSIKVCYLYMYADSIEKPTKYCFYKDEQKEGVKEI
jgi:hypothetical protein